MLQKFILNLLIEASKNDEIRKFAFELVEKLLKALLPDILGTFPTFGAGLLKQALNLPQDVAQIAEGGLKHIIDSDPDIPGLSDIIDLSELARKWLHL